MTLAETETLRIIHEETLAPVVARALTAQGRAIANAVAEERSMEGARAQADIIASDPDIALAILERIVLRAAPPFADATWAELAPAKRAPIDWLQVVMDWLRTNGAVLVVGITDSTRELVSRVLERGVEEGLGAREIARMLRADWPELARVRAERIVRTEVVRASNMASHLAAREAGGAFGLTLEKEWIAALDGRTRDSHAVAHGQKVPIDALFSVGGYGALYPGDPSLPPEESVNCRCTQAYVPIDDEPTRSLRPEVQERRERVWESYPSLRRTVGREIARDKLAEAHGVSPWTIKRDWERRPR